MPEDARGFSGPGSGRTLVAALTSRPKVCRPGWPHTHGHQGQPLRLIRAPSRVARDAADEGQCFEPGRCGGAAGDWLAPIVCNAGRMDLEVSPALTIPSSELSWRFSRSSGPGGQHVNTSDSRVELSWSVVESAALSEDQRMMLVTRLGRRLVAGVITVTASERRSQLRNREIALAKLADLVAGGLAPEPARRRATKPTRGSNRRRLVAKEQRSATKRQRQRPSAE